MGRRTAASGEVTILGAGIVGVCCALSLQEKGYAVTLIDRQPPGEAASYGNAGVISPWSCVPQCMPGTARQIPGWLLSADGPVSIRWRDLLTTIPWALRFLANTRASKVEEISRAMAGLVHDNVDIYRRFLNGTGHENLLRDSWYVNVFCGKANPALSDLAWKLRTEKGAPVEIVKGGQIRDIEPAISEDYHTAVIIKDQARAAAPGRLCKVLADKARAQGARFVQAEVRGIEKAPEGGFVLVTPEDRLPAPRLVLAAGIWSADLLKSLGVKLPLISERGYHLEFSDPGVSLNHSVADVQGRFVVSSMEGGLRSAGTAEFAHHSAPPRYQRADMLGPQTRRLLPALNIEPNERWMGVRPSFPDNLPAIGELRGHAGLFAAFGHSHYGLGMAPVTGRLIAGMIDGSSSNAETSAYAPDRFG
ncbi:NAD(P)/FAD-dependent oxidoreductase [Anderseniella sp. Alg231-50]|uniref:NAD(P)/FAD-dependent oxidoreductase n=1 Tax=Anderseniella sp. Alg231-50 TaxID=1922226 RepID=UPI00307BBD44